jgi:hypothetical protein
MAVHLYLSMIPEALIASMLSPLDFGTYFAVGTQKKARGEAMYFAVDRNFSSNYFPMSEIDSRCVAHADGSPKNSVYLSVYRALEHVPLSAIGNLYLATRDGRVLEIAPEKKLPELPHKYRLYQELCPVDPRVATTLDPAGFAAFMTDPSRSIHVPKIFFADLKLEQLADDPVHGKAGDLPYEDVDHLRGCLVELRTAPQKSTKTVSRSSVGAFPYRTVESGFYLGGDREMRHYPMPSQADLQTKHYVWWRSASQ